MLASREQYEHEMEALALTHDLEMEDARAGARAAILRLEDELRLVRSGAEAEAAAAKDQIRTCVRACGFVSFSFARVCAHTHTPFHAFFIYFI